MKKLFTLCIALLFSCVAMNAQTFAFVDAEGKIIENGTEIVLNDVEVDDYGDSMISLCPISVKNVSDKKNACVVAFKVEKLPENTSFGICCGGSCVEPITTEGDERSFTQELDPGVSVDLTPSEWYVNGVSGTCVVKISARAENEMLPIELIVRFESDATGINGVHDDAVEKVVARYSINGQLLDAPQKGINILKYADGRIEKVIVK